MSERKPLLSTDPSKASDNHRDVLEQLANQISQLNSGVAQLERMANSLGTNRDNETLRRQLSTKREDCAAFAKTTINSVQRLKKDTLSKADKMRFEKMMTQFNEIVERCQTISKQSIQKERTTVPVQQHSVEQSSYNQQPQDDLEKSLRSLAYDSSLVDKQILEERNQEFRSLEKELMGLNEVFVDIASMIKEQGEDLQTIESHTQSAVADSAKAVEELQKASEYQKSARGKMCCILLTVTIIVAAVIVIIILKIKGVI